MKLLHTPLTKKNKGFILENMRQAKQYVSQGKLSQDELQRLVSIDPSGKRKYVGWMSKIWINERPDFDDLRNTVEEFHTFLEKGKAKTKNIEQIRSFKDLKNEVDEINQSGDALSLKELESDYDVIVDNENLYIASPHTHEASRKLGLSKFAYRGCGEDKDSAWCTTFKAPDHFNSYYYTQNATFYYIRVRSKQLIEQLKQAFPKRWQPLTVTALVVLDNGTIDGYDGLDKQMSSSDIKKYTDIIGIS